MPRKKSKARQPVYGKKINIQVGYARIIRVKDDGMSPGRLVAAAEWKVS